MSAALYLCGLVAACGALAALGCLAEKAAERVARALERRRRWIPQAPLPDDRDSLAAFRRLMDLEVRQ